jgi:uncharacterized protein (TIGR00106 family)
MARQKPKVIADITIFPVGVGSSVGDYVRAAFQSMGRVKGVKLEPTAMSTVIEADSLPAVFLAANRAHRTIVKMGAQRVYIVLRIDHRLDKPETARYKLDRIQGRIE